MIKHVSYINTYFVPVDEGRSSKTRLLRGVLLLQSPSEWTEDTEDGRSPTDRPGPGDLVLRPLERPLLLEDFAPPANTRRLWDFHKTSAEMLVWFQKEKACPTLRKAVLCTSINHRHSRRGTGARVGWGAILRLIIIFAHQGLSYDGFKADGVSRRLWSRMAAHIHRSCGKNTNQRKTVKGVSHKSTQV